MEVQNKKTLQKVINIVLNILIVIFGIILLISIYTGIQTKLLGSDHSDFFGYSIFEVQTNSMADKINAGDWIIVDITKNIRLNDIITYKLDGEFITHRVIQTYNGTYITKGDANNARDLPVDQSQIVGKVAKILPNFGILKKTLFNPVVLIALIITLFLFNIVFKKEDSLKDNKFFSKIFNMINTKKKKLELKKESSSEKRLEEKSQKEILRKEKEEKKKQEQLEKELKEKEKLEEKAKQKEQKNSIKYETGPDELAKKVENKEEKVYDFSNYSDEELDSLDDLEKTSLYRVIPVDASEIDDTFLEIAENELNTPEKKTTIKKDEEEEVEEEESSLTNINLELLKSSKFSRGAKTVIDRVMLIKMEELKEIVNALVDEKLTTNEATIKQVFINIYIDVKYYNSYDTYKEELTNNKNMISKFDMIIKDVSKELIKSYKGNDTKYDEKVSKYAKTFTLIRSLENANLTINDSKAKMEFYKKELSIYSKDKNWDSTKIKNVISELNRIERNYVGILEYFYKKMESDTFEVNYDELNTVKDMYAVSLKHNIAFNKIYSDYIIDKTYTVGVIAENKIAILLNLLLTEISKNMASGNFKNKYMVYVPRTLYSKEKKFEKLLSMFEDDYAKNNIIILIKEEEFKYIKLLKKFKKLGYRFALIIDKDYETIETNKINIYIADYIFINKKVVDMDKVLSFIPDDCLDKIIYENIIDKIEDLGSE